VRATLTPYAPGERPWSIRVAVLVAALIGAANLVDLIVGGSIKVGHTHPGKGGVVLFSAMMLVAAGGMWRMKYWALLGFQVILAFVILILALSLIGAHSVLVALAEVAVIAAGGFLFYKLVRVLSRVQMPRRPQR
jgi:signal transduction histidine kinase